MLPALGDALGDETPFAGFAVGQIGALAARFADTSQQFALDYGIDPVGALFRDGDPGNGTASGTCRCLASPVSMLERRCRVAYTGRLLRRRSLVWTSDHSVNRAGRPQHVRVY